MKIADLKAHNAPRPGDKCVLTGPDAASPLLLLLPAVPAALERAWSGGQRSSAPAGNKTADKLLTFLRSYNNKHNGRPPRAVVGS